ncbi:aldehyde dehydrogenase (NAD+) [Cladophialophora psammophila CBS 110553]|uniref:aldehyde dehydrogenase (NAD(+)) n=1 Tax=Cladophialophora psammophila CBS 110553 TaxID=1182543 RepID=W9WWB7_9EURO|nr:aldehyde dehydrogenase (NAD+) [Cladophialophora psammophila CBS 110553]EXJ72497.1 aldehyde dehydrogenase (NAD+) [Cladophialophora psammophila CBS 110553]
MRSREWRSFPPQLRAGLLSRLADLILRDADDLATIEAIDAGILFRDSKTLHIPQAVETLRFFATLTDTAGRSLDIPGGFAYTRREPFGVCAAIVAWNAPLMITIWKLAPAIATGNVLIIKTSELAPLYGQKLAQLVLEAGFPPGVIAILPGLGQVAGKALAEHSLVRKISFTGSRLTGRSILKAAAATNLKKVTLELGGKSPSIVFDDADIDNAVFWTELGSTANNGQVCALGSRIYVQDSIYDGFVKAFQQRAAVTKPTYGDPLSSKTTKGPIINRTQYEKILHYIKKGKEEGGKLLLGGSALDSGIFVENTVFTDVTEDMTVVREEIFGPVATITKFSSEDEVVSKANASEYGLNAAVFTKDISRARRVSDALEVGTVTVNCWGILNANTPFGGVKQSGFGRDMGLEALNEWTTVKTVKHLLLNPVKI